MSPNPFGAESIAKAVHSTLEEAYAAIPEGKTRVFLVDASTDGGVRALYAQRAGKGWEVRAETEWHGGGDVAGKITALWSK